MNGGCDKWGQHSYPNAGIRRSLDSLQEFVVCGLKSESECRIKDSAPNMHSKVDFQHILLLQD